MVAFKLLRITFILSFRCYPYLRKASGRSGYSEKPFFRQPFPRFPHKTSIHPPDYVHGEYEHEEGDIVDIDAVPIEVTYVHSKDNRPDLKQFVTSLRICLLFILYYYNNL